MAFAHLQFLHSYRVLLIGVANIRHEESSHSGAPGKESIHWSTPHHFLNHHTRLPCLIYIWTIEVISPETIKASHELHPPWLSVSSCTICPVIVLYLILYSLLIHYSHVHSPMVYLHYCGWNLCPARWWVTIHRWIKKHTSEQFHSRKQPIFIVHQLFVNQLSSLLHHSADN